MEEIMDSPETFSILKLPELIQTMVLNYLTVNEVLSLRLVCRSTFDWITAYSQSHFKKRLSYNSIYFDTEVKLHSFVTTVFHLPITSFSFQNSSILCESEEIQKFTKNFSPSVKHLHVWEMHLCATDAELAFWESLTSLESVEIHQLIRVEDQIPLKTSKATPRIPQNPTKSLKNFSFGNSGDSAYPFDWVRSCPNLETFSRGKISGDCDCYGMIMIMEYFEERKGRGNFNFEYRFSDSSQLIKTTDKSLRKKFLKCVASAGVKLAGINEQILKYLLEDMESFPRKELEKLAVSIRSLSGISPRVKCLELPNLEEIEFSTDPSTSIGEGSVLVKDWKETPTVHPEWPKLKSICGYIEESEDPEEPSTISADEIVEVAAMMDFLFRSPHKRTAVKEIDLSFGLYLDVPLTPEHFVTNFPNLDTLILRIDSFTKEQHSMLFQLLGRDTKLRRMKLWTPFLCDYEFFAGSPESANTIPYFSTMKHLKHLKLVKYPSDDDDVGHPVGFTDKVFTDILAGMSLKSLKVTGHEANTVTWKGVEKLIDGQFGETIHTFLVELADKPPREQQTKFDESLKKLMLRCKFNSRFEGTKRVRLYWD